MLQNYCNVGRLFWVVYHPPANSHDGVLQGAPMNEECQIWVSVYVVLTST